MFGSVLAADSAAVFTTKASELIQEFRDRQEILAQVLAELN